MTKQLTAAKKWLQREERAIQEALQVAARRSAEAHGVDMATSRALSNHAARVCYQALLELTEIA